METNQSQSDKGDSTIDDVIIFAILVTILYTASNGTKAYDILEKGCANNKALHNLEFRLV